MKIKIPKNLIYVFLALVAMILAFRLGSGSALSGVQGEVREIAVEARQFEFTPNTIRVELGETVRLRLTSVDVTHGFSVPELGINEILKPGETVSVQFEATKRGEFPFACSVACGVGHAGMRGMLIVEKS